MFVVVVHEALLKELRALFYSASAKLTARVNKRENNFSRTATGLFTANKFSCSRTKSDAEEFEIKMCYSRSVRRVGRKVLREF
jgi:hypothetical protein